MQMMIAHALEEGKSKQVSHKRQKTAFVQTTKHCGESSSHIAGSYRNRATGKSD